MKNQTLQTLAVIRKRLDNSRGNYTFEEVLENNKTEINFLSSKFNLKKEEALFLAASCIRTIENRSKEFDIDGLSCVLEVNNFEILLYQKHLTSLIEKQLLVEYQKDCNRNCRYSKSAIELLNKEFMLHSSLGEHLT